MPNRAEHDAFGILAGMLAVLPIVEADSGWRGRARVAGAAAGGMLASHVPDALEPGLHPNHRAHFHSLLAVILAATPLATRPEWYRKIVDALDTETRRLRSQMEMLPVDHPDRAGLLLKEAAFHVLLGSFVGAFGGYVSHPVLDAFTQKGIPIV